MYWTDWDRTSPCSDDNECLRDPCKGKGRCVNRVGSYSCFCYPGYTLATSGATQECQGKLGTPLPLEGARTSQVVLGWKRIQAVTALSHCTAAWGAQGLWDREQGSDLDLGGN